ncbi:MAG: class I SAM-dependent methyltransferase [Defluviitaleaceae bacterium]|nr:class I SAM-dependent methyltransferase [Defluviitaleaceae bacterium]
MRGKKMKIALIAIAAVIVAGIALYQPLINYLGRQAANPTGVVGRIMTRIWSTSFNDLREWGLSHITIDDGDIILSVGFGSGAGIDYMKGLNENITIYGIDISQEAVNSATAINQRHIDTGGVILALGNVAYLDFEDEFFNLIVAGQTHMYWGEVLEQGLLECHRALKQEGILLIYAEIDTTLHFLPEYSNHDDFAALLYEIGFREVSIMLSGNHVAFIGIK